MVSSSTCRAAIVAFSLLAACGDITAPVTDAAVDAPNACSTAATCDPNASCNAGLCECNTGYEGTGLTCADVNECATDNGGCDVNAECLNRPGSRVCRCSAGYVGDGLTCQPVWELQDTLTGSEFEAPFDGFGAAVGDTIWFTRDGQNAATVLFGYNTVARTFENRPVTTVDEFCACGYGQVFVGGLNRLWMFGNDGTFYDPAANRWVNVPSYASSGFRRGEAAGAFDSRTGSVYMVGGRSDVTPSNTTASIANLAAGTYMSEPGQLPVGVSDASAWIIPGDNVLYVAGGNGTDNNRRHFFSHVIGSSTWTELAQLPDDASQTRGMGDYQGKIWVATNAGLHLFDRTTLTWSSVTLPTGFQRAVSANGAVWAIVSTIGSGHIEIHKLVRTE